MDDYGTRIYSLHDLADLCDGGGGCDDTLAAAVRDELIARELLAWQNDADGGWLLPVDDAEWVAILAGCLVATGQSA